MNYSKVSASDQFNQLTTSSAESPAREINKVSEKHDDEHGGDEADDASALSEADISNLPQILVGGFVFLRYLNPSIVNPKSIKPNESNFPRTLRRALVLIAKILQNLSNGVEFARKEKYMQCVNPYMRKNFQRMRNVLLNICDVDSLDHYIEIDNKLEAVDPCIYTSVKELFFCSNLIQKHLFVIAPDSQDPIRQIVDKLVNAELDEKNYTVFHKLHEQKSKFVSIYLSAKGTTHKRKIQSGITSAELIKALVSIPISSLNELIAALSSEGCPILQGPLLLQLETLFDLILPRGSSPLLMTPEQCIIQRMREQIGSISTSAIEQFVQNLFQELNNDLIREKSALLMYRKEVQRQNHLVSELNKKNTYVKEQGLAFEQVLGNVHDQAVFRFGWTQDTDRPTAKTPDVIIGLDKALSSSGLIGGLLTKLQVSVAARLKRHLFQFPEVPEAIFRSVEDLKNNDPIDDRVEFFPRTAVFYESSLQSCSDIGKFCADEVVLMVLKSLPPVEKDTEFISQKQILDAKTSNDFSWAGFFSLVPNLLSSGEKSNSSLPSISRSNTSLPMEVYYCLVETMAVDLIVAVLQHYDGGNQVVLPKFTVDLLIALFRKYTLEVYPVKDTKIKKNLWTALRSRIRDRWAVVLGQLGTFHVESVLRIAPLYLTEISTRQRQQLLKGFQYLHFDTSSVAGIKLLDRYLCLLAEFRSSSVDRDPGVTAQLFETLRLNLEKIDFTGCLPVEQYASISDEKEQSVLIALSRTFHTHIKSLYQVVMSVISSNSDSVFSSSSLDPIKVEIMKLLSTILMHSPKFFSHPKLDDFVQILIKDVNSRDKHKLEIGLVTILHFLRGGGSLHSQIARVSHRAGKFIEPHTSLFGFNHHRLSHKSLNAISLKLITKKNVMSIPEAGQLCERIVVQMAGHDLKWTAENVIGSLLINSKVAAEKIVGLRALEIIIDERSGFGLFLGNRQEIKRLSEFYSDETVEENNPMCLALSACNDNVGLKKLGRVSVARAEKETDCEREASRRTAYFEWIDSQLYKMNTERLGSTSSRSYVDVFYHCLRLFPAILPYKLINPDRPTIESFVGVLLVHSDILIARTAWEGLKRLLINIPSKRVSVMDCFVRLLTANLDGFVVDHDVIALRTYLDHILSSIKLLQTALQAEFERDTTDWKSCLRQSDDQKRLPSFMRWIPKLDAVVVILTGTPDKATRMLASNILKEIQAYLNIFRVQVGISLNQLLDPEIICCIADVIEIYEPVIIKKAFDQYQNSTIRDIDQKASRPIERGQSFFEVLSVGEPSILACVLGMVVYTCVDTGRLNQTISFIRRFNNECFKKNLSQLPLVFSDHTSEIHQAKWLLYHVLTFASGGSSLPGFNIILKSLVVIYLSLL